MIRSGGGDKIINLKILSGLMTELRIKLKITKAGLGPEKTMRVIEQGLDASQSDEYFKMSPSDSENSATQIR